MSEDLSPRSKSDLAEDRARFVYRRAWALRMGIVGLIGLTLSSVAVISIITERPANGVWDAAALAIVPISWLLVTLIPGIIWATNARAVDIARLVSGASSSSSYGGGWGGGWRDEGEDGWRRVKD